MPESIKVSCESVEWRWSEDVLSLSEDRLISLPARRLEKQRLEQSRHVQVQASLLVDVI